MERSARSTPTSPWIIAFVGGLASASLLVCGAKAATEERETPAIGEEITSSVGNPIWERTRFEGEPGVVLESSVNVAWGGLEKVDLPTGSALFVIREKRLKACQERIVYSNLPGAPSVWSNCLMDSDNDGRFDRAMFSADSGSKMLDPPVPYKRTIVANTAPGASRFQRIIIYAGATDGSIRLSYREFATIVRL